MATAEKTSHLLTLTVDLGEMPAIHRTCLLAILDGDMPMAELIPSEEHFTVAAALLRRLQSCCVATGTWSHTNE